MLAGPTLTRSSRARLHASPHRGARARLLTRLRSSRISRRSSRPTRKATLRAARPLRVGSTALAKKGTSNISSQPPPQHSTVHWSTAVPTVILVRVCEGTPAVCRALSVCIQCGSVTGGLDQQQIPASKKWMHASIIARDHVTRVV
jgi:hypothetical protein